jgi:hypothetical protein
MSRPARRAGHARPLRSNSRAAAGSAFSLLFDVLVVAGGWLYFSLLQSSDWQASVGMRALGLSVIGYDGGRISFARATGRYFASFVSGFICYVGYLLIAFTERKQALHDLMASTLVVRARPGATAGTAAAIVVSAALILLLVPIVVIVILLTMGAQIRNVFSNVVVALGS